MNLVVGLPRLEKDWGKTNSINAAKKKKKKKNERKENDQPDDVHHC